MIQLLWEAKQEVEVQRRKRTMTVSFYIIHSGHSRQLWGVFFLPKKSTEHLILAYKWKLWASSSNLILMCQHLKIQCKDNVLKSIIVELHWLLAQLSPSEATTLSQQTLSIHKLSPEPSASVIHPKRYWLNTYNVPGTVRHVGYSVPQWTESLTSWSLQSKWGYQTINKHTNDYKHIKWKECCEKGMQKGVERVRFKQDLSEEMMFRLIPKR